MSVTREPGLRVPAWVHDVVASVLIVAFNAAVVAFRPGEISPAWVVATSAPAALMFVRRRYPRTVLAAVIVFSVVATLLPPSGAGTIVAPAFALFSTASVVPRWRGWMLTAGCAVVLAVAVSVGQDVSFGAALAQSGLVCGIAMALADAARTRRAYTDELRLRALRAEQTREAEAARAVAEDRLRIARDLHDSVAHRISVMSLSAGVASSTLESNPQAAQEALSTIRSASRAVLTDIGALLGSLREQTVVGLASLDELVGDFATAGLEVDVRVDGDVAALPAPVDVLAYRVVQEGLTNAMKHGDGDARLGITVTPEQVRVKVRNRVGRAARTHTSVGASYGLLGMRERVEEAGGVLEAGRVGDEHALSVRVPLAAQVRA
ncbi:sensor histidine kinase [Microbacterium esteraromaticum]|uniref:histidine kinase n=1 Tax=Microbacterium esteraromaticum TaxID=57043 RepID=A0A939IWB0_9MICO|nr:sensor histidine kinase [Microbacterium esteraromaticum]MBN8416683.1 sensor histidine kinase [Microbacterium esteraromaticum]